MSTVIGRYVRVFAAANMGMLEGVSLNAPYDFHWVHLVRVDGKTVVCTGAGKELELPLRSTRHGERAKVTIEDPVFGPVTFDVAPFLADGRPPIGGSLGL